MKLTLVLLLSFLFVLAGQNCESHAQMENRPMYAAGSFYPADSDELTSLLNDCFAKAKPNKTTGETLAIISPHAGYVYSGVVAASAYNQIDPYKKYKNIFILGVAHSAMVSGASIYNIGNYLTPLGEAKVNTKLATELIENYEVFSFNKKAHLNEHSVEVQIPFLQYKLKKDFQIVPIVVGGGNLITFQKIADALLPYSNEENLFVISSDFSHYPSYNNAVKVDKLTSEAIESNSVQKLVTTLSENDKLGIPNLATSMCGWPSVLTLLFMTQNYPNIEIDHIQYLNSGDVPFGDKTRVVGYNAFSISLKNNIQASTSFQLHVQEKLELLRIARNTIEQYLSNDKIPEVDHEKITPNMLQHCGAFVTLYKHGQLRGCIGRFIVNDPLYKVVQQMAVASATQDYRFKTVTKNELPLLKIEISVLSPLHKIKSIDEFELGKHGIYLIKGNRSGTFLPQVANETNWTKEEYLGHCAQDKAGIGWDGWKDADLYIYEALVFSEKELGLK